MTPCFSLSAVSRPRSPNSLWWKFASANQRSTLAGTARDSSAARSAATSVSAFWASCSNVWRPMGSRVLTTMTVGFARWAIASGSAPNSDAARVAGRRRCAHHDEVRALGLAQDRGADVGGLAQERLGAGGHELAANDGEGPLGLGADRLRDAGRHEVHDDDRGVVAVGERVREAQRQLRVRAAADRDEDPADVAGPALLDDGDVARRLAHDLVDRGADDRTRRDPGAAPDLPPQPKIMRSASCSAAASTMPGGGVAPDAHERVDDGPLGDVVEDLLEQAPGLAGARRALGERHALRHLHDAQGGQLARPLLQQRRRRSGSAPPRSAGSRPG